MSKSTLYVRHAGFGDMLKQINIFFHLSDAWSFTPQVVIPATDARNTLNSRTFFDEIGFSEIIDAAPAVPMGKSPSLSKMSSDLLPTYQFDAVCYNNPELEQIVGGRDRETHPKLRALATRSKLYGEIAKRKKDQTQIVLHVRRGDVAQINADDFPGVFDRAAVAGRILHSIGLFDKARLQTELPFSYRRRFVDTATYLDTLNQIKTREKIDDHILVSDGFTRPASFLIATHPELFLDKSLSADALATLLQQELQPLMEGASKTIIGETNPLFYETIFTSLAAKIIISQSAGFLEELSKLFELDIQFICPEPQPIVQSASVTPA